MKPFLISLTSDVDGVKSNYLDSVHKLGDSVEPIMVAFQPQPPQVNFQVIPVGYPYPGNLGRFKYFPQGFDDNDTIVFTDTSDVIFQCPLPEISHQKIYVSDEYDLWGVDNWWKSKLDDYDFHELDGKPIYCMGTWAMPYFYVKDLLKFMKDHQFRFDSADWSDQLMFNWWLKGQNFYINSELFCSLYDGFGKGVIKKKDGVFCDFFGKPISVVHGNGDSKIYL